MAKNPLWVCRCSYTARTETKGLVSAVAWRTLLYGLKAPFDEVAVELALHPAPNHITPRAA